MVHVPTARDSSLKMAHGLTTVLLECGLPCTDDGPRYLRVLHGFGVCSPPAVTARERRLGAGPLSSYNVLLRDRQRRLRVLTILLSFV